MMASASSSVAIDLYCIGVQNCILWVSARIHVGTYQSTCSAFVCTIKEHNPAMLKKKKVHLILHLPAPMHDFGPTSAYNTERYTEYILIMLTHVKSCGRCEPFNSLVRAQNVYTNWHNPSHDIATGFAIREQLIYIASGGCYGPNNDRLVTTSRYSTYIFAYT